MLTKEQFLKDAVDLHIRTETAEIFWKVVDKLIELGFEPYGNNTREHLWFAKYIFLYTGDASIHPRSAPDGQKEIQVSDILGSDYNIDKLQLEVGKWYKWLWKKNNKITYGKINFVADDCFDVLEGVQNDKYSKINGYFFKGCTNIELLTDLSEIQQYLPDGHPDKLSKLLTIGDLVEGEIYYCLNNTICKWGKNDSTHSINIEDKDIWDNEPGGYTGQYGFRLATPEEEQWLNVCISEGKFIEKEVALRNYDMYGKTLKSEINEKKMKRCVRCDNELQFDFAAKKLKCTQKRWFLSENHNCISLEEENRSQNEDYYIREGFKVLSFQEWLDLDDYAFEKEIKEKFKVGDWVYADRQSDGDFRYELGDSYIPVFKVEEIYKFPVGSIWLRPIKNKASGIESKYCRLATPEEIAKVTKVVDKPFEFNKWYKYEGQPKYLAFIHKNGRYGFNTDGDWFDQKEPDSIEHFNKHKDSFVLAEDSEVKERLLNYTKEKYPLGTKFKCMVYNKEFTVTNPNYMDTSDELETIWVGVKEQCSGKIFDSDGKWAEIISTPETKESKEMQLSDLKNPVFNIGDKVRLIANSLKEFNSSWGWGNNSTYRKGYEGLITKIKETKSGFEEINTWYCLDNNSNGISCNLLELVEPVKKEFDRNWYNKPQKQLSDILPEYKQPIKTEEELSHIIDTNEDLRNEIQGLINQRDFKSSDFVEPIIIKSKKQKRNKLIIVNN